MAHQFGFDLKRPVRRGYLLKQGGTHKAFKNRYFVLYPGFLVYYNSEDKYVFDVARGTLGVSVIYLSVNLREMCSLFDCS